MSDSTPPIIELRGVGKSYERGGERLDVLKNLDLTAPEGAFEALMGPSGSGKSTLLNIIAGLDRPTSGTVRVAGVDLMALS
ncbi:MAG: ATP-binding cassette domain-containing protein, partial [Deltaproteobacteria bacterium]|nr:ATP-binding cassette domain-containing protein [Deltaproteobacteria bacterium]